MPSLQNPRSRHFYYSHSKRILFVSLLTLLLFVLNRLEYWFLSNGHGPSKNNHVKYATDSEDDSATLKTAAANTTVTAASAMFFHRAGRDRSGSVIHDMLLAHAYCFKHNFTYGGACLESSSSSLPRLQDHLMMVDVLGLRHVLKFECPSNSTDHTVPLTDKRLYARFGTKLWTKAWVDHIVGTQQKATRVSERAVDEVKTIAVHIRRGDVELCNLETKDRYLVNRHYLDIIQYQLATLGQNDAIVHIFSEKNSSESWDDFTKDSRYRLHLDQAPGDVWKAMMQADILVLSMSSFSIVPAVFNPSAKVLYTPFWVKPLPEWTVVDDDTVRKSLRATVRLRSQVCDS